MALKNKISNLIDILKKTDIDEIEVSSFWGAQKIRVSNKKEYTNNVIASHNIDNNNSSSSVSSEKPAITEPLLNINENESIINANTKTLKAPLVGTYYSSPKPDSPSFVNVGDSIKKGQTICIIEAMKIFNEIESEYDGIVTDILVENGTPVEFDQDLLILK